MKIINPQRFACPTCGAKPGAPCVSGSSIPVEHYARKLVAYRKSTN